MACNRSSQSKIVGWTRLTRTSGAPQFRKITGINTNLINYRWSKPLLNSRPQTQKRRTRITDLCRRRPRKRALRQNNHRFRLSKNTTISCRSMGNKNASIWPKVLNCASSSFKILSHFKNTKLGTHPTTLKLNSVWTGWPHLCLATVKRQSLLMASHTESLDRVK